MSTNPAAHSIVIEPFAGRVVVRFNGETVADSADALVLREGSLPPVHYLPVDEVRTDLLVASDHTTHCPFKGDARYWSIRVGDVTADNAVWSYPTPLVAVAAIRDRFAFYTSKVDEIAVESTV